VPYRNAAALTSYYTGVFSVIPCLGLILVPVAIVAGILGLIRAAQHPESHGRSHAWTGIALGLVSIAEHVGGWFLLNQP